MSSKVAYSKQSVTSKDGTTIGFRQLGRGPAIVILHGGALASQHYMKLGSALADAFTRRPTERVLLLITTRLAS
jgi:pimeloyl-ACP methyl ester carboxylesterase